MPGAASRTCVCDAAPGPSISDGCQRVLACTVDADLQSLFLLRYIKKMNTTPQPHHSSDQPQSQLQPSAAEVFLESFDRLTDNDRQFMAGEIKSVPHSNVREANLIACVESMAKMCGTELEKINSIDSRGEFHIVALGSAGFGARADRKTFGEAFGGALTAAGVRTGSIAYGYGAVMDADASWCYMNHFSAQKMVSDFHASLCEADSDSVGSDRPRSGG